jgi:transglutaminase-like putative cysteine protease
MQRYKIVHRTYYNFSGEVTLGPHSLRLRPREGYELRIESSSLNITPPATLRWRRDAEDNDVATATFSTPTRKLAIESEVIIQQFNESPLDFLVADYAVNFPFSYTAEDYAVLAPYISPHPQTDSALLANWLAGVWKPGEPIQSYALLQRLCVHIFKTLSYQLREEPGVQSVAETLTRSSGSCRDSAFLLMEAARHLGLAARFVSGYIYAQPSADNFGSTHAWAEVLLPGAGWKGFDPSIGKIVGHEHIAVAVARLPESVPPVAGSFVGTPGANMSVGVWVTELK